VAIVAATFATPNSSEPSSISNWEATMLSDDVMARLARDLADALRRYARERRSDDRQQIARLQTELCATRRQELKAQEDLRLEGEQ
jgi:hypothetical protein